MFSTSLNAEPNVSAKPEMNIDFIINMMKQDKSFKEMSICLGFTVEQSTGMFKKAFTSCGKKFDMVEQGKAFQGCVETTMQKLSGKTKEQVEACEKKIKNNKK